MKQQNNPQTMRDSYYNPQELYSQNINNKENPFSFNLVNTFYNTRNKNSTFFFNNVAAVQIGKNDPIGALSIKFDKYKVKETDTTSLGHSEPRALSIALKNMSINKKDQEAQGLQQQLTDFTPNSGFLGKVDQDDINSYESLKYLYDNADKYKNYLIGDNRVTLLTERPPCSPYTRNNTQYNNPGCSILLNKIFPDDNQVGYTARTQYLKADKASTTVKDSFGKLQEAYNERKSQQNQKLLYNQILGMSSQQQKVVNSNNNTFFPLNFQQQNQQQQQQQSQNALQKGMQRGTSQDPLAINSDDEVQKVYPNIIADLGGMSQGNQQQQQQILSQQNNNTIQIESSEEDDNPFYQSPTKSQEARMNNLLGINSQGQDVDRGVLGRHIDNNLYYSQQPQSNNNGYFNTLQQQSSQPVVNNHNSQLPSMSEQRPISSQMWKNFFKRYDK